MCLKKCTVLTKKMQVPFLYLYQFKAIFYLTSIFIFAVCCTMLSHVWLFVIPWTVAQPGSSAHGISQARILEWVAISSSMRIFLTQGSNPGFLCLLHWQVLAPSGKPHAICIMKPLFEWQQCYVQHWDCTTVSFLQFHTNYKHTLLIKALTVNIAFI